jgi:hypothetical protein
MKYSLKQTKLHHNILSFFQYKTVQTEVQKQTKNSLQMDSKAESTDDVRQQKAKTDICVVDLQGMAEVSSQAC